MRWISSAERGRANAEAIAKNDTWFDTLISHYGGERLTLTPSPAIKSGQRSGGILTDADHKRIKELWLDRELEFEHGGGRRCIRRILAPIDSGGAVEVVGEIAGMGGQGPITLSPLTEIEPNYPITERSP